MKNYSIPVVCIIIYALSSQMQAQDYRFIILRQLDDFEQFNNPEYETYNTLKVLSLGDSVKLGLGGSYRAQWEHFTNQTLGSNDPNDENWYLGRLFLHSDLRIANTWQFFLEVGSSHTASREVFRPVDRDIWHVNQGFVRYRSNALEVVLGRENLNYGSGRILTFREGPNVRQSFDGARINYRWTTQAKSELLFYSTVKNKPGAFDNDFVLGDELVWGLYNWIGAKTDKNNYELYYLGYDAELERYHNAEGEETRHSLGLRTIHTLGSLSFNNEFLYQFGSVGEQDISAWTASINGLYQLTNTLSLGLNGELISGDRDANDNTLNTFNPLYPKGAYFGRVAFFGPYNLMDVHPYIMFQHKRLLFEVDFYSFWRFSDEDGIHSLPGQLLANNDSGEKFIAKQWGLHANYRWNSFLSSDIEVNYIDPGSFLNVSGFNENLFYVLWTTQVNF